jgi:hypothetical protein
MIWFSEPPPKPKKLKPPPESEPPLRPCDARRVNREYHEGQEKLRQEAQKAIDKEAEKQRKAKADERPAAVYYEGGPNSGKINWAATKKLQDQWNATHGIF